MVNSPWKQQCAPCPAAEQQLLPHYFERHQWQRTKMISMLYLIYKWVVAIQFLIVLICSIFNKTRYGKTNNTYWKWLAFLTNWGYTLCTLQSLMSLWIIQAAWINKSSILDGRSKIPRHYKVYWYINTAAVDVSLTITVMYWCTVHNPEIHQLDAINLLVHIGNTIMMVIDLLIVAHPNFFRHIIYGIMTGLSYSVFTYIYYVCGGTDREGRPYIYEALDWRRPGRATIFVAVSVTVVSAAHCVTWSISRLRRWIAGPKSNLSPHPNSVLAMQEKPIFTEMA